MRQKRGYFQPEKKRKDKFADNSVETSARLSSERKIGEQ